MTDVTSVPESPVAPDLTEQRGRWPVFSDEALRVGFRSVYALPMRLRNDTIGALNLFHRDLDGLRQPTLRLGQALSADPRMCPGLAEGVAAVFRDESRHIGFGRTAAGEGLATGYGGAIIDGYRLGVATAARVMVGPAR